MKLFFLSCYLISTIWTNSSGAPKCPLTTTEMENGMQGNSKDYGFKIKASAGKLVKNKKIKITITGPKYTGILLYPSSGSIEAPSKLFKTLICNGAGGGVTQVDSKPKSLPVKFVWNPDEKDQSDLEIVAYVVQGGQDKWQRLDLEVKGNGKQKTAVVGKDVPSKPANKNEASGGKSVMLYLLPVVVGGLTGWWFGKRE